MCRVAEACVPVPAIVLASTFVVVAAVLCALTALAVLGITHVYMSGSDGIKNDGMARGTLAPAWNLADSSGTVYKSPPRKSLQLIVFGNQSLKSFPSVVDGLHELSSLDPDLEIVLLLAQQQELAEPVLRLLGLGNIPVLTGSQSLYGRYNVRVSPFLIFVDSAGLVRASSIVNYDWQIMMLYRVAGIAPDPVGRSAAARLRRRLQRAEA
jgi:hypothetical protein